MSTQLAAQPDPVFPHRQAYIAAAKAADVNGLASVVSDDVVLMSPNDTTVYGKDEYRAWWEEYFQYFRLTAFSESERTVAVDDGFAVEHAKYMVAVVPVAGGSRMRDDGRTLTIWKRQADDSWKIWQMIWNSSSPIGIGTNRYISRLMQKKPRASR